MVKKQKDNISQNDINLRLDLNRLTSLQENIKFIKRFQLQIVYYTLLVNFGIAFFSLNNNNIYKNNNIYIGLALVVFIVVLFFVFYFYQRSIINGMNDCREQQSEIEKYHEYRGWRKRKFLRSEKKLLADKLYFGGYIFLTFLSALFAVYSVFLSFM